MLLQSDCQDVEAIRKEFGLVEDFSEEEKQEIELEEKYVIWLWESATKLRPGYNNDRCPADSYPRPFDRLPDFARHAGLVSISDRPGFYTLVESEPIIFPGNPSRTGLYANGVKVVREIERHSALGHVFEDV